MKTMKYLYKGVMTPLYLIAKAEGINKNTLRHRILKAGKDLDTALSMVTQVQRRVENGSKMCKFCGEVKPIDQFIHLKRRTGKEYTSRCRDCDRKRCSSARDNIKRAVLLKYSNGSLKCAICGESRVEVLDIDHVNGGGRQERRGFPSPSVFYRMLEKSTKRDDLRVLCRNCNWIEHLRLRKWGEYRE